MAKYGFPLVSKETSENIYRARHCRKDSNAYKKAMGIYNGDSRFSASIPKKYLFMVNEEFDTHYYCCKILKKDTGKLYQKQTGLSPILGIMASESRLRQTTYLNRGGCNVFAQKGKDRSTSHPLSIWLEKDIWECIEKYNIPIADIYKKGATRTGCMFCGYGCQFKDDNRLQLVYDLYPKWYNHFMNYTNNGVTYREALRKVLAVNGLYLPDEKP